MGHWVTLSRCGVGARSDAQPFVALLGGARRLWIAPSHYLSPSHWQQLDELRADPAVRVYSADAVEGGAGAAVQSATPERVRIVAMPTLLPPAMSLSRLSPTRTQRVGSTFMVVAPSDVIDLTTAVVVTSDFSLNGARAHPLRYSTPAAAAAPM